MKNKYEIRGDITAIFLNYKKDIVETIIDTNDLPKANEYSGQWGARWNKATKTFYVYGNTSRFSNPKTDNERGRGALALHRWLMNTPNHLQVDHIHHNTLDNRRSYNLRNVTQFENQQNKKGTHADKKNGGVLNVHKDRNSWNVMIRENGKGKHLGTFPTKELAEEFSIKYRAKFRPFSKEAREHEIDDSFTGQLDRNKALSSNKLGVRGVHNSDGIYVAELSHKKIKYLLGYFQNLEDAANQVKLAKERIMQSLDISDLIYSKDSTARNNNKIGIRGVCFHKASGKYQAQFMHRGKSYHLGVFETAEEAASILKEAKEKYYQKLNQSAG